MSNFLPSPELQITPDLFRTSLAGLYYIPQRIFPDERGQYAEIARLPEIEAEIGRSFAIKQLNVSTSNTNVIRGIHAEKWDKLLTVIHGTAFCAWADLRPESSTFGQTVTAIMGDSPNTLTGSMFVTAGIGNSFAVTTGPLHYLYGVSQLYAERDPSGDVAVSLFDSDLNIEWPFSQEAAIISQRDLAGQSLRELFPEQFSNQ